MRIRLGNKELRKAEKRKIVLAVVSSGVAGIIIGGLVAGLVVVASKH